MVDAIVLTALADVTRALEHPALEPPRIDGPGETLALRSAMARFSSVADHAERRTAVATAIVALDPTRAAGVAADRTGAQLDGAPVDVMRSIARWVPTATLATLLGATVEIDEIVGDVESIARVIGRGESASADSDAATRRLRDRFGDHELGWVPVASILYQGFDATMWLIAVTLHARAFGLATRAPVPRTRRIARRDAVIGGLALRQGTDVVLEIGAVGLPYGAGAYRCPGTQIAEQIVAGVVLSVDRAGYRVDLDRVSIDADGRPTTLHLLPPAAS